MKFYTATSIFLTILGWSGLVVAHDWDSKLGPSPAASDYFQVHCFDDGQGAGPTKSLEVTLLTQSKAVPVVSLQVKTDDSSVPFTIANTTDPVGGDTVASKSIDITNNLANTADITSHNGFYYITVNKTQAGVQSYHFTYHCLGVNGHAGTDIQALQDQ